MSLVGNSTRELFASPTEVVGRHQFVDLLRGFALLGILVVNIEYGIHGLDQGWEQYRSTVDVGVRWVILTFGQAKIYPIFALLFGYGLSLQLQKTSSNLTERYRRRMVALFFLGIAHGILFFPGDILTIYAIVGALTFRLRTRSTAWLLKAGVAVYGTAGVGWLALGALDRLASSSPTGVPPSTIPTVFLEGSLVDVAGANSGYWVVTFFILLVVQGPAVFASFVVGMVLGRTDWLVNPSKALTATPASVKIAAAIALIVAGLGGALELAADVRWHTLGFALGFVSAPLVAGGYLLALARMFGSSVGVVARLLQSAGRMSLTVYLLESVVVAYMAHGYGLGLLGAVSPLAGLALAVGIWLGLAGLSHVWLRRLRFGPFEWLLRSVTYKRWQSAATRPRR